MKSYKKNSLNLKETLKSLSAPYVLLDTLVSDQQNRRSFLFNDFIDVLEFRGKDNPKYFFKKIENYLKKGYWLAGFFDYEFGYCLEPALGGFKLGKNKILAWLGVCRLPKVINKKNDLFFDFRKDRIPLVRNIKATISKKIYSDKISRIKSYLEEGLTYQVNYTFKLKFDLSAELFDFYISLCSSQPTPYAALINIGRKQVISLSPELFFEINKGSVIVRPMKGTMKRGVTPKEDLKAREELKTNPKTRAENIMIVDLLRNDLGRISSNVRVNKLFEVERYRTLYQMTSSIEASLKKNISLYDIFSSLFPSGSVTGAPKIKTMQLIKELESGPRGVYTGAIGYFSPEKACFNVAIRTIELRGKKGQIGIGGGIVFDSVDKDEYNEALLKAKFLVNKDKDFYLFETILFDKGELIYLKEHLKRLKSSAEYFSIPFKRANIYRKLQELKIKKNRCFKIRIILDVFGKIRVEKRAFKLNKGRVRVKMSNKKVDPRNCFLYHKTNQRTLYDQEKIKANKQDFFEVIFLNSYQELTEGSFSNLFISKNSRLYTPTLESGLLGGVLRARLIKEGKAKEKKLKLKDLIEADKVFIGNSVRGLIEAEVCI